MQDLKHFVAMLASSLTVEEKRYWQKLFFARYESMPLDEQISVTNEVMA